MIQAMFIDRDGTIGGSDRVEYPGEFELFSFVPESIALLREKGITLFFFTNQPGISRGEAVIKDFDRELKRFGFDQVYLCPHAPQDNCGCRKPEAGMLMQAKQEYNLDLKKCVVVGDRWTDLVAGHHAECHTILVRTGAGEEAYRKNFYTEYPKEWAEIKPDYVANDFSNAVEWVLKNLNKGAG